MASTETNDPINPFHTQSTHSGLNCSNDSNVSNPYFFNSIENLGNILITQPLLGMKNNHSWSRVIVLALTAKKNIGFVNGKIPMPDPDSPLYEDW